MEPEPNRDQSAAGGSLACGPAVEAAHSDTPAGKSCSEDCGGTGCRWQSQYTWEQPHAQIQTLRMPKGGEPHSRLGFLHCVQATHPGTRCLQVR